MHFSVQPSESWQPPEHCRSAKHSALPWHAHHVSGQLVAMQPVHASPHDEHVMGSAPELDEATLPTPDGPAVTANIAPPLPLPLVELPPPPPVPSDGGPPSTKTVEYAVARAHTMGAKTARRIATIVANRARGCREDCGRRVACALQ